MRDTDVIGASALHQGGEGRGDHLVYILYQEALNATNIH
jgi:hypothetical protein